jgi:hypothetical protein
MTVAAFVAAASTTTVIGVHAAVDDDRRKTTAPRPAAAAGVATVDGRDAVPSGATRAALAERQARKEARERAARRARKERIAQERASRSAAQVRDVDGIRGIAARIAASRHGWGADQFSCLDSLWERESGWDAGATNPSSGAYGIPQALPGSKMAGAGADWRTNPVTQVEWGLGYIDGRYGSPCAAWSSLRSRGWY